MGNRGRIHTEEQKLGTKRWAHQSWVICRLDFRGRRRTLMAPNSYTELFFLDEPTALAVGHRPCGECRRPEFNCFRDLWLKVNGERLGNKSRSIARIDRFLHAERVNWRREQITWQAPLDALPYGAMVRLAEEDSSWLLWARRLLRWTVYGYTESRPIASATVEVLTPRSVVNVLAAGYQPVVHQSAELGRASVMHSSNAGNSVRH